MSAIAQDYLKCYVNLENVKVGSAGEGQVWLIAKVIPEIDPKKMALKKKRTYTLTNDIIRETFSVLRKIF